MKNAILVAGLLAVAVAASGTTAGFTLELVKCCVFVGVVNVAVICNAPSRAPALKLSIVHALSVPLVELSSTHNRYAVLPEGHALENGATPLTVPAAASESAGIFVQLPAAPVRL